MTAYLGSVWSCRYFWLSLVRMDLRNRYRGSVLGIGWSLAHPLAATVVICAVYYKLLKADVTEFVPFLLAGLACWNYLVGVTLSGCQCFVQAEPYIRQHALPLAIYPLRTTLGATVHLALALGVVIALTAALRGLHHPTALLALVPTMALLMLLGWSVGVLAGFVNTVFRDTHHLLEVTFQILFYLSAVIYPKELLYQNGLGWLAACNPLVAFQSLIRDPVLYGSWPSGSDIALTMAVAGLATTAAAVVLRYGSRHLIHYL
ncbi:MAG: ABC transporter permease [Gemmatales bacterium]|nr:ABC transporter permease [Gemmatales bacterium]MDW8387646.1 ABC transporter permease [Gemmatales bacterium]